MYPRNYFVSGAVAGVSTLVWTCVWADSHTTAVPSNGSAGYLPNLYRRPDRDNIPLAVYAKCLDLHPSFFSFFFLKHLIKSGVRDWNVATPRDMWRLGEPVLARLTCGVGALGPVHVQLCRCLGFLMQAKHEARSPSLKGVRC